MNNFNQEKIKELVQHTHEPAVSVYLPMERAGDETLKNPIRIKNMRKQIESQLQISGYDEQLIQAIVGRFDELTDGYEFAQNQLDGVAIYIAKDFMKLVKLPYKFDEGVYIGKTFELRPLLQAFQNGQEYYVIAASREHARLFSADKFNIVEIELGSDVPTSFEEAMKFDQPEDRLHHQTISGADGGRTPVFHGHTESDQEKKNIRRFFRMLDEGIMDAVAHHDKPFLLVGLAYLQPIYREATKLPHVLDVGLDKNPDDMDIKELHHQSWALVKEALKSDVKKAITQYEEMLGTEKSSSNLKEISLAAAYGKIDTLLVEKQAQVMGQVKPAQQEVEPEENGEVDLLKFSVNQTLKHSGDVFVFDEEDMPSEKSPALAVLRY
jgi:hypothetical protein